jgi:hypothetical protein
MAFKDFCSCYLFASTGFNDEDAGTVQRLFEAYPDWNKNEIKELNKVGLDAKVKHLVEALRSLSGATDANPEKEIIVFGVFDQATSATPTHMWIKYGKDLYDTMPNAPLRKREKAAKDNLPPSVDGEEPVKKIGKYKCNMTTWQLANITNNALYK